MKEQFENFLEFMQDSDIPLFDKIALGFVVTGVMLVGCLLVVALFVALFRSPAPTLLALGFLSFFFSVAYLIIKYD